jgi:hypothetical protein
MRSKVAITLALLLALAACQSNKASTDGTMTNPNLCDSDKAQDEGFC